MIRIETWTAGIQEIKPTPHCMSKWIDTFHTASRQLMLFHLCCFCRTDQENLRPDKRFMGTGAFLCKFQQIDARPLWPTAATFAQAQLTTSAMLATSMHLTRCLSLKFSWM
uniref:Uncharacterized protein n=1 Tax=Craspedostauros australis TaxID=1486917 RepID=A0A7R9ZN41_9STRA|mmetsp:Transcript_23080/g.64396  ORF Transcript_23080/g.64396 Transcript_23080/m.64396 type:complete len:111 (+) Transcript_23080:387-719(+)